MRQSLFVLWIAVLTLSSCAQTKETTLDNIFIKLNKDEGFNGVVLVHHKKKTLFHNAYGCKDFEKGIKHTNKSIFPIASNTKQFTSEVILKLMLEEKLKLTDNLNTYLPNYPNGGLISIYNLLTHTSGIYNYTDSPCINSVDPTKPIDLNQLIELFSNQPLLFEPDSKYSYSNSNYALLGYIIEHITQQEYEQVVTNEIFEPLHMYKSGFDYINLDDTNKSISYYQADGEMHPHIVYDSTFSYAAGGIYSSTEDMLRWYQALNTFKILPAEIQNKAYEPYMNGYALGWNVNTYRDKKNIFHFGNISGFISIELFNDETYIIILSNYMGNTIDKVELIKQILDVLDN